MYIAGQFWRWRFGWALIAILAVTTLSRAQTPSTTTPLAAEAITQEVVDSQRQQAEQLGDVAEEAKAAALEQYRIALDNLQRTSNLEKARAELEANAANVAEQARRTNEQLEAIKQQLAAEPDSRSGELSGMNLSQLEQELVSREQRLRESREALTAIDQQIADRPGRRKAIRAKLASADSDLAQIKAQLEAVPPTGEAPVLTQAKKTNLLTQRQLAAVELPALQAELALLDAEDALDLLRLKRELIAKQLELAEGSAKLAQAAVQRERERTARVAVAVAQSEAERVDPALQFLADRNQELAVMADAVAKKVRRADRYKKSYSAELEQLRKDFNDARRRVEKFVDSARLPASVGAALRVKQSHLPNLRNHNLRLQRRQTFIDEAQILLWDLEDERTNLPSVEHAVQRAVEAYDGVPLKDSQLSSLKQQAENLLVRRSEFLETLVSLQQKYFDTMTDASLDQEQIVQVTRQFSDFIEENVLWIRSDPSMLSQEAWSSADWQVGQWSWLRGIRNLLVGDFRQHTATYVAFALAWLIVWRTGVRAGSLLDRIGEQARKGSYTRFAPTVQTFLVTIWMALPLPLLATFVFWRMRGPASQDELAASIAWGACAMTIAVASFELVRVLCRANGLADAHFQWPTAAVSRLRRVFRVLTFAITPLVGISEALISLNLERGSGLLERLLFIVGAVMYCWAVATLLHPTKGIFSEYLQRHEEGWFSRLRYLWYPLVVALPLSLAGLAFCGYYYTARQLAVRFFISVFLTSGVFVIFSLLSRLILIQRRKLRIAQARQRQQAVMNETTEAGSLPAPPVEDFLVSDLQDQTLQTRRFVAIVLLGVVLVGYWAAWSNVLPALGFLERWPLWTSTRVISEPKTDESGATRIVTREIVKPVTIVDLAFGGLIAVVTLVVARNLPGMLEIAVLQRLPLENSVRYAIATLGRYLILLLGMFIAFTCVGLRWSQIQWMATALTFGLAFGLQEMFANFVAGIIILFERPVRVGDIVTIDEVTGVVARVRIRATTVTNWDRKDYIVPNKDFITGRVLNWTLSDQVNRIVVNVGVAYGSDITLVRRVLERMARRHPVIVDEPGPIVTFEEFGASSLNFVIRCYIAMRDMPMRLQVVDDLHTQIDEEFRNAGVEIAFPQTDLHIRTIPKQWMESPPSRQSASADSAEP